MDAHEQVMRNLTNHPPTSGEVVEKFEQVRMFAKYLGVAILEECPESRERSLALTKLEETVMWAVASIARNQES